MARRLAGRFGYPKAPDHFKPTWHEDEFHKPFPTGKPKIIFVTSMGDIFDKFANKEWSKKILQVIRDTPKHKFVILTKQPWNILKFWPRHEIRELPSNLWLGVSVTNQRDRKYISWLQRFHYDGNWKRIVSFEPLLGPVRPNLRNIKWVIIGAESGNQTTKTVPKKQWIQGIVLRAQLRHKPIYMKDNLADSWGEDLRKEFP